LRLVAEAVITLRVLRKGTRTNELLEDVARRLGRESLAPDDLGAVRIRVHGRPPKAWEEVRDALDGTGDDWRQLVHLSPRPSR
jgi:predicted Rdx family selenoprotein